MPGNARRRVVVSSIPPRGGEVPPPEKGGLRLCMGERGGQQEGPVGAARQ